MVISLSSIGIGDPFRQRICWQFDGRLSAGRSLNPSSNLACVPSFTRLVASSCHKSTRWVKGMYPRKIPFRASDLNRFEQIPGGQTWTRHPQVQRFVKLSFFLVDKKSGDEGWLRCGIAFRIRITWWKANGQNFKCWFAPKRSARTHWATVLCALSTAPLLKDESEPVG